MKKIKIKKLKKMVDGLIGVDDLVESLGYTIHDLIFISKHPYGGDFLMLSKNQEPCFDHDVPLGLLGIWKTDHQRCITTSNKDLKRLRSELDARIHWTALCPSVFEEPKL